MANVKLSQITSGGAFDPSTDNIVTVRNGNTDVITTFGGVMSFTSPNSTLTISGTSTLTADINLTNANTWTGIQAFSPTARTSGHASYFPITSPADTGLTASTECIGVNFNLSASRQFATGGITTQREFLIQAPTYTAVGASTITNAATLVITGPPIAGTNVTITNPYSLWLQTGDLNLGGNVWMATNNQIYFNGTGNYIDYNGTSLRLVSAAAGMNINANGLGINATPVSGYPLTVAGNLGFYATYNWSIVNSGDAHWGMRSFNSGSSYYIDLLTGASSQGANKGICGWRLFDMGTYNGSRLLVDGNGQFNFWDGALLAFGTSTGTQIGTSTSQKLAFYGATPVVQQSGNVLTGLSNLGLITSPTLSTANLPTNQTLREITFSLDGQGSAIASGGTWYLAACPFAGTITGWNIVADTSGSIVVDVWKVNAAVPTVSNTITASSLPTLSSAQSAFSGSISGWTTAVAVGDVFAFHVNSASTVTKLSLTIEITAS